MLNFLSLYQLSVVYVKFIKVKDLSIIVKNIEPYVTTPTMVRKKESMNTLADAIDSFALSRIREGGLLEN